MFKINHKDTRTTPLASSVRSIHNTIISFRIFCVNKTTLKRKRNSMRKRKIKNYISKMAEFD